MNLLKTVVAAAAAATIVLAFRDVENGRWLQPALPGRTGWDGEDDEDEGGEEPVLGYDGMDRDTLIDWLGEADLDDADLVRIRRYELANAARQPVLDAIEDLMGVGV
jgi:hypothetical protein